MVYPTQIRTLIRLSKIVQHFLSSEKIKAISYGSYLMVAAFYVKVRIDTAEQNMTYVVMFSVLQYARGENVAGEPVI